MEENGRYVPRSLRVWLTPVEEPPAPKPPKPSWADLEIDAIIEKLKEEHSNYPYVACDMDFDGRPYLHDSSYLRIAGVRIESGKVIFTLDVDPTQIRNAQEEIAKFFGDIGFHHFSNGGCHNGAQLKPGRYALYESEERAINDAIFKHGSCQIAVNKESLMEHLEMHFVTKFTMHATLDGKPEQRGR